MARRRRPRACRSRSTWPSAPSGPTPRADGAPDAGRTGSRPSPTTSGRRTCATRSPRAPSRRSASSSTRSGSTPGMRVLDVGCGPGRHAHALARAGHRGLGVDISPALRRPRHRARRADRRHVRAGRRPATCPSTASSTPPSRCARARFGLRRRPPATAGRRRRARRHGPGRCGPAGRLAVSAFSRLLPGPLPRGRRHASTPPPGVNHERTDGARTRRAPSAELDLWTTCFTPRELRLLAAARRARASSTSGRSTPGRLRRATRPTSTTPSSCWWPAAPTPDRWR